MFWKNKLKIDAPSLYYCKFKTEYRKRVPRKTLPNV